LIMIHASSSFKKLQANKEGAINAIIVSINE